MSEKSPFDGIECDIKIKGTVILDIVIDTDTYIKLPASVQRAIVEKGVTVDK